MLNSAGQLNSTSSNNNNLTASSIPLPPGSPPPTPIYDPDMQQQQQQQHQQQHQQPHQQPHQPQQQLHTQQHTPLQYYRPQPAFGGVKEPMTFASLAKKTDNVVSETLSQYGPVMPTMVGSPIPTIGQQTVPAYPGMMTGMPISYNIHQGQQQYNHYSQNPLLSRSSSSILTSTPPIYNIQPQISNTSGMPTSSHTASTHQMGYASTSSSNTTYNQPTVLMARGSTISVLNNVSTTSSSNHSMTIASQNSTQPVASISPPLDPLRAQQDSSANKEQATDESATFNVLDDIKKRCENMVLNQVLEEHRHLKSKLHEFQQKRQSLETEIHDMRRNLPGHGNLETHPKFIRLKEKERECDGKCKQYSDAIKYVTGVLFTKWQHVIPPDSDVQQPLQKIKRNPPPARAKMSTATPPTKPVKDKPEESGLLLELSDGNTWCKVCDVHFTTFKEYLEHLHTRGHENSVGQARTPWRKSSDPLPRMNLIKTYNKIKSICGNVSSELKQNFKVQDMDEILNPSLKHSERLKNLNLDRERGKFDVKGDRLLQLKGYDQIVPIKGYYCKLCDLVMCDVREGEEHERSVQHNKAHAKFVALSDLSEKKFLSDLEKSLKVHQEEEHRERESSSRSRQDRPREPSTSKIKDIFMPHSSHPVITPAVRAERVANEVSQFSARLPYKKPTSRIVDDHEVILDKFDKRHEDKRVAPKRDEKQAEKKRDEPKKDDRSTRNPVAESPKKNKTSHEPSSSKSADTALKRKIPEIVPIKKSSSGALKKLRKENKTIENEKDDKEVHKEEEPKPGPSKRSDDQPARKRSKVIESSSTDDDDAPPPLSPPPPRPCTPSKAKTKALDLVSRASGARYIEEGDPDSPFPHLELCVNGNVHRDVLKNKQLFQRPKVVMNRINPEDYKDLILPPDDLFTRISFLMAKKEASDKPGEPDATNLLTVTTVMNPETGEALPVDLEEEDRSSDGKDFNIADLTEFFVSR